MHKSILTLLIAAFGLSGCGGSNGDSGSQQAGEPKLPEVTVLEAEQAMSDAMLVSALSLFLAFSAEDGATSVSNEDGSLTLSWDEDADLTTGVGLYTISMTNYTVPADDPFGADYNGYSLSGTVLMGSTDGTSSTMNMALTMTHEDAENYPVQSIAIELTSIEGSTTEPPTGNITINGHEMRLEDLAQAF